MKDDKTNGGMPDSRKDSNASEHGSAPMKKRVPKSRIVMDIFRPLMEKGGYDYACREFRKWALENGFEVIPEDETPEERDYRLELGRCWYDYLARKYKIPSSFYLEGDTIEEQQDNEALLYEDAVEAEGPERKRKYEQRFREWYYDEERNQKYLDDILHGREPNLGMEWEDEI